MNKTVNINIGGLFFYIDEDAYQKLSRYFEAIKNSLSNSSGKDEIMKDIEMRVAELFIEKRKSEKHVINFNDVEEVIEIMGQPEDYKIDDEAPETPPQYARRKKLYRDTDNGVIGGVATGLGHYFGIDAVWIKIAFVFFSIVGGFGFITYLIFWIATPAAITTSEKLEMTGEPVTISSIEKKVREEFDSVSNKLKKVNYDALGRRTGSRIEDLIVGIFKIFSKVIGAVIVLISSIALLGICIASITLLFSSSLPQITLINHINTPFGLETPLWIQGVLFLFTFGIPMLFLLFLGLKIVVINFKSIGNATKYSLLAIWIIAVSILISLGINEANQKAYEGKEVKKESIITSSSDTLFVKFTNNDFYSKNIDDNIDFKLTQDDKNKEIIYSNSISIEILKTDESTPYLQIEKLASGKSTVEAKKRTKKINYGYKIIGSQIILDNYLVTDISNKFRDQHVNIYLYLPKGTLLKMDKSIENYNNSDEDYNFSTDDENYIYKMESNHLKCLTCPPDNKHYGVEGIINAEENDSSKTITIKLNGKTFIKNTINKRQ